MAEQVRFDWTEVLAALAQQGLWMADPEGPDHVTADGRKVDVVARGMHAGTRHNSHRVLFEPASVQEAIRQLDASLPGKDGHGTWGDSSYGDSAVYWHRVEMGEKIAHPEGGKTFPVYFLGSFDPESQAATRIRRAAANHVTIYTSVVVTPGESGLLWGDDGPTISKFVFDALDFVRTPSDKEAKAHLVMDGTNAIIRLSGEVLNWDRPATPDQEIEMGNEVEEQQQSGETPEFQVQTAAMAEMQAQQSAMQTEMQAMTLKQAAAEARQVDGTTLESKLDDLTELPETLRFEADRAIRKAFVELRSTQPDDSAGTLVALAYEQAITPFRKQQADVLMQGERTAATAEPGDAPQVQLSVIDTFENDFGRPGFERPLVSMLEYWEMTGDNRSKFRGEAGTHFLPSTMNFRNAPNVGLQWENTRQMMDDMLKAPLDAHQPDGPKYEDALKEEARLFDEAGGDQRMFLRLLTDLAREKPGWWMASLGSDFVAPRSVDMMPINAIYPMLPGMAAVDAGMVSSTKYTLTVETRVPVAKVAFTVAAPTNTTLAAGSYYDLGYKHIDRESTFTMGSLVDGTDFVLDYTLGRLYNIKTTDITLAAVTAAQHRPYNKAEGSTPAESKTKLEERIEDLFWDEILVKYTRRAEVEPLMNAGYPTASRLQFAALFDIQESISRDIANTAWLALRYLNSANTSKVGATAAKTAIDRDAYVAFGQMCAGRRDAGFSPTMGLMSYGAIDAFTNLDEFYEDGIVSSRVNTMNMITSIKGVPVMPMRFWAEAIGTFPRLAITQPPIARYRMLAQNGIRVNTLQSMFDTSGSIVNGSQYIVSVCHTLNPIYKNEHNSVLTGESA